MRAATLDLMLENDRDFDGVFGANDEVFWPLLRVTLIFLMKGLEPIRLRFQIKSLLFMAMDRMEAQFVLRRERLYFALLDHGMR